MRREPGQWLQSPAVSIKLTAIVSIFWIALLVAFEISPLSFEAEKRIVDPILYRVRELLNRAPPLDPRIRVYAIDDATVAATRKPQLRFDQWIEILEAMDRRRPKAIVIDALFSVIDSTFDDDEASRKNLLERLKAIKTPIILGSYATSKKIHGRVPWDKDDPAFAVENYIKSLPQSPLDFKEEAKALSLADFKNHYVYGPDVLLRPALSRIGHILYGQKEGKFYPFLRLSDQQFLPHIMLRARGDAFFQQGQLYISGHELPVAGDGSAYINFSSYDTLWKQVKSIKSLLQPETVEKELSKIGSEDYIYLILMYYTGNTDFKPTPIGLVSGAFSHLCILNNILRGDWLRLIEAGPWLVAGFGIIASLLAFWLTPVPMLITITVFSVFWTGFCIYCFSWLGWVVPWLGPAASFFLVGLTIAALRMREMERKSWYIRKSLEGTIESKALRELAKHPEKLALQARERVLTIMFIDIVGFSLMVENQLPRTVFESLRGLIDELSATVHSLGGVVNKTLGDGLLCFFGYSFDDDRESSDHAEQAMRAAIEIQRANAPRIIDSARRREPVFPLRIGINTAAVFLGNLGSGEKLDFTVIGNGVNFAKRLEGACLPHSILVGPTTKELLEPLAGRAHAKKRLISIKHHAELVEAWEYDPFADMPELRERAEEVYRTSSYVSRVERRWTVANPERMKLMTLFGEARLVNFSSHGMSFTLASLTPRGTRIELQIDSKDGSLQQQLSGFGLQKILVEVRWVQKMEERFLHGIRYLDLDARQTDLITDLLCQYALAEYSKYPDNSSAS